MVEGSNASETVSAGNSRKNTHTRGRVIDQCLVADACDRKVEDCRDGAVRLIERDLGGATAAAAGQAVECLTAGVAAIEIGDHLVDETRCGRQRGSGERCAELRRAVLHLEDTQVGAEPRRRPVGLVGVRLLSELKDGVGGDAADRRSESDIDQGSGEAGIVGEGDRVEPSETLGDAGRVIWTAELQVTPSSLDVW